MTAGSSQMVLLIRCPDRTGLVAAVAGFLAAQDASITESHQFNDPANGRFFMRTAFTLNRCNCFDHQALREKFAGIAAELNMEWELVDRAERPRVVIAVSKFGHCLQDLFHRWQAGTLPVDIVAVISNHSDLRSFVEWAGVPFHHLPTGGTTKLEQERDFLEIVKSGSADLVVLARYMQILSDELCAALSGRCINIHHSFLPSFKGAKPYHQAHERGVKIIGATAHYVTTDLDEGPIIEQDVERVGHSPSPEELVQRGRDIECRVLARAVAWHVDQRVMLNGRRTIVFS
jgi:formyltetrahydrofolate deformylase